MSLRTEGTARRARAPAPPGPDAGEVTALAQRWAVASARRPGGVSADRLLRAALSDPAFKTGLFRFVDVFPAMTDDRDTLRHARELIVTAGTPRFVRAALAMAGAVPAVGAPVTARLARRAIEHMANHFIVGSSPEAAAPALRVLWNRGIGCVVDQLGEKTLTAAEADAYTAKVVGLVGTLAASAAGWPDDPVLAHDHLGPRCRVSVSVKPTALSPHFSPLSRADGLAEAGDRLAAICDAALAAGAELWLDAEHLDVADLTAELFTTVLGRPRYLGLDAGLVVQAYRRASAGDIADLVAWSRRRRAAGGAPAGIRLVKGAYWDAETLAARSAGWESQIFTEKRHSDANFERCARLVIDGADSVRPALGSHNLRSLAYGVTYARASGLDDRVVEIQMLYGMAAPMDTVVRNDGLRVRVYAPVGELVPGMAYLVRRLLENTANESFVRRRYTDRGSLAALLAPPDADDLPGPPPLTRRPATDPARPGPYRPEPVLEWHLPGPRQAFASALDDVVATGLGHDIPAVVAGEPVDGSGRIVSVDPSDGVTVVARAADCGPGDVDVAVAAAGRAQPAWGRRSWEQRAAVIFGTADLLRRRRLELAALEVVEAGKPWAEADADVTEAIDFCEYYARQALRLAGGGSVESVPGERNSLLYQPRGVMAVIAPWNFPLAILTGMTVAALVTGNAVCMKPAEQTPAVAWQLVRALTDAGLPESVLHFLPGRGDITGAALVEHPGVAQVVFTGSRDVGMSIMQAAARPRPGMRQFKRVIAELGGKNAAIVDADVDLDAAVPAIVSSAFGFAGQKCSALSRLIVLDDVHDDLLDRLAGAVDGLRVGSAHDMGTDVGPLIDAEARAKVSGYIEEARRGGRMVCGDRPLPRQGFFVAPTVVAGVAEDSRLATEEVFGPLLAVFRAPDLDAALRSANATDYALTAGVFSRSPATIQRCAAELRAGNVYVNRRITAAVVGRQPFGGYGLSGVGAKAGGPDYLLQFCDSRAVTENTVRQGFAPDLI